MKHLLLILLITTKAHAGDVTNVLRLADANGFQPDARIARAIVKASRRYHIDARELAAIAIVETGLGKYTRSTPNDNGTIDEGIFQINSVNFSRCVEYNLKSPEGSAYCAAKLLSTIKHARSDYLGVWHSKTPSKKIKYMKKVTQVLSTLADKQ